MCVTHEPLALSCHTESDVLGHSRWVSSSIANACLLPKQQTKHQLRVQQPRHNHCQLRHNLALTAERALPICQDHNSFLLWQLVARVYKPSTREMETRYNKKIQQQMQHQCQHSHAMLCSMAAMLSKQNKGHVLYMQALYLVLEHAMGPSCG